VRATGSRNRNRTLLAKPGPSSEDWGHGRKEVVLQMSDRPATPEVAGC
jgi:hypothetical protein